VDEAIKTRWRITAKKVYDEMKILLLTCSICLSTFDCPVTIPCGHNFCQNCLLSTWTESYSCPQCRTLFETRPELKKNTVLSTVVETFRVRSSKTEGGSIFSVRKGCRRKSSHSSSSIAAH
uniref:RING-type domain-containing protein n=1 Tax=Poecilia mexicana TaxID=48701 RepID=A0A3B3WF54_9TELE